MKKKILIFIVFISAFLCFGMNAKADMVCSYILSDDSEYTRYDMSFDPYVMFYNYLLYKKNGSQALTPDDLTATQTKINNFISYLIKLKYNREVNSSAVRKITLQLTINGTAVTKFNSFVDVNSGSGWFALNDFEMSGNYFDDVSAPQVPNPGKCPDLLFVKPSNMKTSYSNVPYLIPATYSYFNGDFSHFYNSINFPTDDRVYLIGISTSTAFKSYYDNFKCILDGLYEENGANVDTRFASLSKIEELANSFDRGTGFYAKIDRIIENNDSQYSSDMIDVLGIIFERYNDSTILDIKKTLSNSLKTEAIETCFKGKGNSSLAWLKANASNSTIRHAFLLKYILDGITPDNIGGVREALSNYKFETDLNEWTGCTNNCQNAAEPDDCYNSCDKDHPYAVCEIEKDPQYKSCLSECKASDNSCIQNCEAIKAPCSINCDNLVSNHPNTSEKKLYDEIASSNDCTNLASSDDEVECIKLTCEEMMSDEKYLNDNSNSLVNDYNDMKNGTTAAQQAMDHLLNSIKDSMIQHGGIEIDDNDICNILKDIEAYKRAALLIIAIGGPILVIILTGYDAITMIASSKDEDNKKFFKRLKIRLILIAVLILVPVIINWLLEIFEIHSCN